MLGDCQVSGKTLWDLHAWWLLCAVYIPFSALRQLGGSMYLPKLWSFWDGEHCLSAPWLPPGFSLFMESSAGWVAVHQLWHVCCLGTGLIPSKVVFVAWGIFTPVKVTDHIGRATILTLWSALCIVYCKEVLWLKGTPSSLFFLILPQKIISLPDYFHDPVPCKPSQVGMSSRVRRWQTSLNCLAFVLHKKRCFFGARKLRLPEQK